jgi:hypothetical protein
MPTASGFSNDAYWTEFELSDDDLDFIYNLLLEREVPLTSAEMSRELVERRLAQLKEEAKQASKSEHKSYKPEESFAKGETLVFPAIGNAVGEVVKVRPGVNPDMGEFEVIEVKFGKGEPTREFAASLQDHILNNPASADEEQDALSTTDGVLAVYRRVIEERLEVRLLDAEDIIRIAGRWFHKALVVDINEGHLNIAEAVLDVANGGPLPTSGLLEHVGIPQGINPLLMEFSMDYAMQEDERFDEVGPAGEILWYLKRLEPPEVLYTPPRLESDESSIDRSKLTDELLELEALLDDELSPLPSLDGKPDDVTITLLFPHWRVGTLPLSTRLRPMFPTAYEAPRIRFKLIDGHSGDRFPGWVVREKGYVFGLDEWYRRYDVPTGGLVKVTRGDNPGEVKVETLDRRRHNDWIRTVTIDEEGKIGFTMLKQSVGTAYDDRMVVGLIDPAALDEAWMRGSQRSLPMDQLIAYIFRELARLTPQSAVHAQSLYSGVNVFRRMSPAAVFSELVSRPYYEHVGDLYWRFDQKAWANP